MRTDSHARAHDIDELIQTPSLVEHPFIIAWRDGTMLRDDVRALAPQLFMLLEAWPRFISRAHSHMHNAAVRRVYMAALEMVEPSGASAADLWLQTCSALGLFSDSVRAAAPAPTTLHAIDEFYYQSGDTPISACAALLTLACDVRDFCKETRSGLAHFGLASGPGATFFDVIGYSAEMQAKRLRAVLDVLDAEREGLDDTEIRDAAESAATAFRALLDS